MFLFELTFYWVLTDLPLSPRVKNPHEAHQLVMFRAYAHTLFQNRGRGIVCSILVLIVRGRILFL